MVFLSHTVTGIGVEPVSGIGRQVYGLFKLGWAGVDLFFVLSGFLITGILVDQKKLLHGQPGKFFGYFYARRSLRIFPLYYGALAIFLLAGHLATGKSHDFRDFFIHALYLQNIIGTYPMALSHFWSLAVEEHFYLILPLVIYWTPTRMLVKVMLAGVILSVAARILLADGTINVYRFSPTRFDGLLLGGLLSLEVRRPAGLSKHAAVFFAGASVALLAYLLLSGDRSSQAYAHKTCGYLGFAIFFTCMIRYVLQSAPGMPLKLLFRTHALRWLGKLSYCVYIVHWPIILAVSRGLPDNLEWPMAALLCTSATAAISLAIAVISWRWFESPILSMRSRFEITK